MMIDPVYSFALLVLMFGANFIYQTYLSTTIAIAEQAQYWTKEDDTGKSKYYYIPYLIIDSFLWCAVLHIFPVVYGAIFNTELTFKYYIIRFSCEFILHIVINDSYFNWHLFSFPKYFILVCIQVMALWIAYV